MFEKKEYIVSSSFGICMVEKITKLVVGRERQMEYYVLQSLKDLNKKSYIPVEQHETILRVPMTEQEAETLLKGLPIVANDSRMQKNLMYEEVRQLLEGGEPEKWAFGCIYYLRNRDTLDSQMCSVLGKIWENLTGELAFVLKKSQDDIRQIFENAIE